MGHHQRRQTQLDDQFAQKDPRLFPQLSVEVRQGFIQQNDRRVIYQRPADGHALLLSSGELMRVAIAKMPQAQLIEHALHPLFDLRGGDLT